MPQDQVSFRPFVRDDIEPLAALANNPRVSAHLHDHFPYPYTNAAAKEWVELNLAQERPSNFAITAGGEFAGGIGLILGKDIYRCSGEIGYWLGEPYWGRGIASACLIEFTPWVFQNFEVQRLFAAVFESNPASKRVLEKAGFELEGRLKKSVIKGERIMDSFLYAKLRGA